MMQLRNISGFAWPALALAFIWTCALPHPALAYVDPSVMTYTIQALAGVAVALSAVLGVAARKTRKLLMDLLDLDESRKRVVDPPVYRLDAKGNPITPVTEAPADEPVEEAEDATPAKKPLMECMPKSIRKFYDWLPIDKRTFKPTWPQRLVFSLLASALTFGTIFILSPLEIVGGSAGSLVFGLADIWWIPLLAGLILVLASTVVLSLFPGRLFVLLATAVASVGLCAYIQCLCLNIGVPIANGDTLVWGDHAFMMTVCAVVWTAIIALCVLLSQVNLRRTTGLIAVVSVCLLAVQTVGVLSLAIAPPEKEGAADGDGLTGNVLAQKEAIATEEGLYTVSSKENIIMFVLDTFDTSTMKYLMNSDPHVLDEYTGFTCFTNVTGSMIPTHYAVPALLTGSLPQQGEDWATYVSTRYERGTFLSDLEAAGYSIGLYSDSLGVGEIGTVQQQYDQVVSKTMNIHSVSTSTIDLQGTLEALWQVALYREMPWGMKPLFWYYTDQINKAMVKYDPADNPADTVYIIDDARYYTQLQNLGLSVDESDAQYNGAFRFIHLLGPHYPYSIDRNANFIGVDKSNMNDQALGSLHIVSTYLELLKEKGLYDNATIIVTADHGTWWLRNEPLTSASCPILLVKPSQDAQGAQESVKVTSSPVSHADILATIRESAGLPAGGPSEGAHTVWDFTERDTFDRTRYYYTTNTETRRETAILEYAITGDAGFIRNWELTGVTWDPSL